MISKFSILIICSCVLTVCSPTGKASDDAVASALILLDPNVRGTSNTATTSAGTVETSVSNGVYATVANASSSSEWVYVSLKEGGKKAGSSSQWDLRFKRFVIGTNSGTSGSGNGGSCDTTKTDLSDASITSSICTIAVDSTQSQTSDGGFGSANDSASPSMFVWYNYDGTTHLLKTKNLVYLIRGSEGTYYRLQMLDYYSSAGTSGYMKFSWKSL
jgi:hypothetical protein